MEARKNPDVVAYEEKMKETGKAHFLYCPDIYDNTAGMFSTYEAGKVVGNAFLKYGLVEKSACPRQKNIKFIKVL